MKTIATATVVALATLSSASQPPSSQRDDGAVVIHEDRGCSIPGSVVGAPRRIQLTYHEMRTPNGVGKLFCHGQVPDGYEPERTLVYERRCFGHRFGSGPGHVVITRSGQVNITCTRMEPR